MPAPNENSVRAGLGPFARRLPGVVTLAERLATIENRLAAVESGLAAVREFAHDGTKASAELLRREKKRASARAEFGKLDYERAEIYLQLSSRFEILRLNSCAKEPWTVEWIEQRIAGGQVLWDIGANVGPYALVAAKAHGSELDIIAFEPGYANYAALCENVALNEVESIVPLPFALGDTTGISYLSYSEAEPGAADHALSDVPAGQPLACYRADDLVTQLGLPCPNHIKLDVDGSELEVLRGASEILSSRDLQTLMVEVHAGEGEELESLLHDQDLAVETRFEQREKHGRPVDHRYVLFSRAAR